MKNEVREVQWNQVRFWELLSQSLCVLNYLDEVPIDGPGVGGGGGVGVGLEGIVGGGVSSCDLLLSPPS